jgi:hypothetical protein
MAMKQLSILCLSVVCLYSAIILSSCSEEKPISETDRVKQLLVNGGNWKPTSISIDGTSGMDYFSGFTIRFQNNNTYTTTGTTPVWSRSGAWTFTSDQATAFTREDGAIVDIVGISTTALTLRLTWKDTTLGGGRVSSIGGAHVFTFVPG